MLCFVNASLVFGFLHCEYEVADDVREISRNRAQFENEHATEISLYQRLLSLCVSRLFYEPSEDTRDIKDNTIFSYKTRAIDC